MSILSNKPVISSEVREIPHYPSVASRDSSTTLRSARNDSNDMNERYIKWYTPYLSREFEMLVSSFLNGYHDDNIYFNSSYE